MLDSKSFLAITQTEYFESETDLGLLQHPRFEALHLGCCSSPRSATANATDDADFQLFLSYFCVAFN